MSFPTHSSSGLPALPAPFSRNSSPRLIVVTIWFTRHNSGCIRGSLGGLDGHPGPHSLARKRKREVANDGTKNRQEAGRVGGE